VQGRAEGRAEGLQNGLMQILANRYGSVPEAVRHKVERIRSLEHLLELYTEALRAQDIDTFTQTVEKYLPADEA